MAKILIVEDNQGTNKAICEYMKEAGHTLFSAFTGSEALKIFREKELDIIVLDTRMWPPLQSAWSQSWSTTSRCTTLKSRTALPTSAS